MFVLGGTNLGSLTASSFADAVNATGNQQNATMIARFRGFIDGGSDKVPGGPTTSAPVPEPSLMAMGAAGLAGLFGIRRKFGKKAAA